MAGHAHGLAITGTLEISPVARRRMHYRLEFYFGAERCTLEGWKSVTPLRPLASMTVLPFVLTNEGERIGHGTVRFSLATALVPFLVSFRFPRRERHQQWAPRWKGQPGRTEVWYTTATDQATGTGLWLHHELTAPTDGSQPVAHGWAALFPPDRQVQHARFGPAPWHTPAAGFAAAGVEALPGRLRGRAGSLHWDLVETPERAPLYTFPRWSWRHPLLPAAQMVPAATARYTGTVRHGDIELTLRDASGATARIYGHDNARRWAWLHADLGGGDVLEIIAAISMRPGLDRLPPLVFLRWRTGGRTWPRGGLRTAIGWAGISRFTARIACPPGRSAGAQACGASTSKSPNRFRAPLLWNTPTPTAATPYAATARALTRGSCWNRGGAGRMDTRRDGARRRRRCGGWWGGAVGGSTWYALRIRAASFSWLGGGAGAAHTVLRSTARMGAGGLVCAAARPRDRLGQARIAAPSASASTLWSTRRTVASRGCQPGVGD
ncbi:hypothetical protein [Streptomyces sp. RKAG293]|uniref:hypothetical protein n=1 Tax=Streptomyces sp. RKAG293 TaxID=2893403 RepID=UPI002033EE02|nr:hypothetical protein [Streptomyces sp. RKAG293]MCM2416533.1 hypothetical protein [Streptomyces sp. RKAG293]